jgi:hypothetical protein
MVRLAIASVMLLIASLPAALPTAAGASDQLGRPQDVAAQTQLAERMIVCTRRGCRALREGCRLVRAPHPRNNRVLCGPAAVA